MSPATVVRRLLWLSTVTPGAELRESNGVPSHLRHAPPMQRGQKPRSLHESPASRSSPQWSQRNRTAPCASTPHFRKLRSSFTSSVVWRGSASPRHLRVARRGTSRGAPSRCDAACSPEGPSVMSARARPACHASLGTALWEVNCEESAPQLAEVAAGGGGYPRSARRRAPSARRGYEVARARRASVAGEERAGIHAPAE